MGVFLGPGNALGTRIALDDAAQHIFGMCLLNDWSARDLQAWESQPLGPFLAKSFATTISPWIVTMEALAPYRGPWTRAEGDPPPLPYLDSPRHRAEGALEVELEVWLSTERMQRENRPAVRLARSNARTLYWGIEQMVAHHTINGCNLQPGDLLGTGTQSGPGPDELGSLLELTQGGRKPVDLGDGEQRRFLEDGDTVILRGHADGAGKARVGFGEVTGQVLPALPI
jgi:fumarylacetoacetase